MAGISTSLTIKDRFTSTINKATAGIDRMLKKMKEVDSKSIKMRPADAFRTVRSALSMTNEELDEFIRKQTKAAEGSKKIKGAWSGVGGLIKTAAAGFGAMQAMQAIDTYTNNKARLGLLTDSLEEQKTLQEQIYQAAQRSRGSYNGMVDSVSKLGLLAGNAFKGNDEMVAFAELMNKSFTISGADTSQIDAGMLQLTQAMAAGRLQGDEYVSIMENAPMLIEAISKYTGKTKAELKELSSEGFITSDIIKASLFSAADDIEAKFGAMPRTFASTWTQISNFALNKFGGVMERINGFLNSATGTALISGITAGISFLANAISWVIDMVSRIGNAVAANWGIIQTVLTIVGAILAAWAWTMLPTLIVKGGLMVAKYWAMVPPVLAQAAAWLAVNWPILLVALAIGAVILILKKMGITFDQVIGFIGGLIGGLYAYFYNNVAGMWNYWVSFAEFFANVFNHPVYTVKRLFVNLANSVLDVVKEIATAIDAVFGSNLAGSIQGLQNTMTNWLGEMPDGYKVLDRMEMKSITDTVKKGYSTGKGIGEGIADTVGGLFDFNSTDPFGIDGASSMFDTGNIDSIGSVGEVGKISNDVNIADEDLKLMKDVAEMRYVQNFVSVTPTVTQTIGTVTQTADVNAMLSEAERITRDEMAADAEDIYY